ncbi:hypothetical protein CSPHI_09870 [Corynebacterium sphenisci DSM 44792]|uniref:DUF3239 domain-containing protein n=1 Tax=Corynebacterium sphenisci DSM 44792 TaxID=1437874 RepID=A0A1L7CZP6_9CORY|nr:DUF3239 domain-containing protein [Corynebacterium sphenisci]APT91263.1 hypothetical protein CSPHI_09870 [Corynebacterium sphenisci DSM 44792]
MSQFRIPVDDAHVRAHNEYFRDSRRLRLSAAIMAVLLWAAGAVLLWRLGHTGWPLFLGIAAFVFGVMCALVALTLPRTIGTPRQLYDDHPLAPAVIAEIGPRDMTLLALVDTAAEEGTDPRPALAVRTVTGLPGVARAVGARVPAVAVGGRHSAAAIHYDEVTPVPVCWATPDAAAVAAAEAEIPERRWRVLAEAIDRVGEVRATKRGLLPLARG